MDHVPGTWDLPFILREPLYCKQAACACEQQTIWGVRQQGLSTFSAKNASHVIMALLTAMGKYKKWPPNSDISDTGQLEWSP